MQSATGTTQPEKGHRMASSAYHLLRVRLKEGIFQALCQAADAETESSGVRTCVSDIVRSALMDWMHAHYPSVSLSGTRRGGKPAFIPSGLAEPPAAEDEDAALAQAVAMLDMEAELAGLVEEFMQD